MYQDLSAPSIEILGVSVDIYHFKLLIAWITAYPLCLLLVRINNIFIKDPVTQRRFANLFSFIVGLAILTFVSEDIAFAANMFALNAFVYVAITKTGIHPLAMMVLLMAHMLYNDIYFTRNGKYAVTSGAQMMFIIKWMALHSYHHDKVIRKGPEKDYINGYKEQKFPDFIEFLGYTFFFPLIMTGPSVRYEDYQLLIANARFRTTKSQKKGASRALVISIISCAIWILGEKYLPVSFFSSTQFTRDTGIVLKFVYVIAMRITFEALYYFVWTLVTGPIHLITDSPYLTERFSNCSPFSSVFCTNCMQCMGIWNVRTHEWLKRDIFNRLQPTLGNTAASLGTFTISSLWHGFQPACYISLFTLFFDQRSNRFLKKVVEPVFQGHKITALLYKLIIWVYFQCVASYYLMPFIIRDWDASLVFLASFNYVPHYMLAGFTVASYAYDALNPDISHSKKKKTE